MVVPCRAPVRPRVISPFTGETLLLEDEIPLLMERRGPAVIWLVGTCGSGKSAALQHLAATLPERIPGDVVFDAQRPLQAGDVLLLDDAIPDRVPIDGVVIATAGECSSITRGPHDTVLSLAGWGRDECIEYLLARHQERCRSVMVRLAHPDFGSLPDGRPELWRQILDLMAADESLGTVPNAVSRLIDHALPSGAGRSLAARWALLIIQNNEVGAAALRRRFELIDRFERVQGVLRHTPVIVHLAAELLIRLIRRHKSFWNCGLPIPEALVVKVASGVCDNSAALQYLQRVVKGNEAQLQGAAASLLHAAQPDWRPTKFTFGRLFGRKLVGPVLDCACLRGADWSGLDLSGVYFGRANLQNSRFSNVNLAKACLDGTSLVRAHWNEVNLVEARLQKCNLAGAVLRRIVANRCLACYAGFQGTLVEDSDLEETDWREATLDGAQFLRVSLRGARFQAVQSLLGARFTGCDLSNATLSGLCLRLAEFIDCIFTSVCLRRCDLEGMSLPCSCFRDATFHCALLTGSDFSRSDLSGADLRGAGLAEIDWPGVDLRNADLRGVTFHLGTTRSGLVDSPIASLGTRTGFYTDDYCEQDFKSPEEIRKANLRGADLRGANIEGVDFYLVDLRDAWFDPDQEAQFRATGAILSCGGDDERDRSSE